MDTGPGIWEYRAFGQEERTSFSRILRPIGVLMIGKPGVSWKFDKGLVGVKLKVHEGDRPPSAEIQNAGIFTIQHPNIRRELRISSRLSISQSRIFIAFPS